MKRRATILVVAAVVALAGAFLVLLYARGADTRADQRFAAVRVLEATKQIDPGETVAAAEAAGKFRLGSIAQGQQLPGALTDPGDLGTISKDVAQTTIYPGEQILPGKFATSTAATSTLPIPKGKMAISVNLTDPARVAGFVNPGDSVAIFMQGTDNGNAFSRLMLRKVPVIGVGTTTVVPTTITDQTGAQTTEQLPRTLLTIAVNQREAQKVLFGAGNGELALGLLSDSSRTTAGDGVDYTSLFD